MFRHFHVNSRQLEVLPSLLISAACPLSVSFLLSFHAFKTYSLLSLHAFPLLLFVFHSLLSVFCAFSFQSEISSCISLYCEHNSSLLSAGSVLQPYKSSISFFPSSSPAPKSWPIQPNVRADWPQYLEKRAIISTGDMLVKSIRIV